MQGFSFHCPTEIVFGRGAEERTAELLRKYGAHRVFIVYGGGSVIKSGLLARVERVITAAGLAFSVRGGVRPNPRLSFAREAVREALDFEADFLLAVGGGSVIDTAKAIAHGTANPETDLWDFWSGKKELKKSLPVGVILTLPAAGSETSDSSVLTNEETGEKAGLPSPFNRPAFAILNPELAFSLSSPQLAAGIADIVMHTLERYMTHTEGNEFTDLLAEALLQNVAKYAPIVLAHHKNYEAMSEIMWCGTISHCGLTGLGRDKDFSVHKLGHALSARYDTNHGESLTALWGAWARAVYEDHPERFARFAEKVWGVDAGSAEERARAGIRKTEEFFRSLKLPISLGELPTGILEHGALEALADNVTANGTKTVGTFHSVDRAFALKIYTAANH